MDNCLVCSTSFGAFHMVGKGKYRVNSKFENTDCTLIKFLKSVLNGTPYAAGKNKYVCKDCHQFLVKLFKLRIQCGELEGEIKHRVGMRVRPFVKNTPETKTADKSVDARPKYGEDPDRTTSRIKFLHCYYKEDTVEPEKEPEAEVEEKPPAKLTFKQHIAKSIARSHYGEALKSLFSHSQAARNALYKMMYKEVRKEIRHSPKTLSKRVLPHKPTKPALAKFSWVKFLAEIEKKMPMVYHACCGMLGVPGILSDHNRKKRRLHTNLRVACMINIALFHRFPSRFNFMQSVNSLRLWKYGNVNRVLASLNHLGVCVQSSAAKFRYLKVFDGETTQQEDTPQEGAENEDSIAGASDTHNQPDSSPFNEEEICPTPPAETSAMETAEPEIMGSIELADESNRRRRSARVIIKKVRQDTAITPTEEPCDNLDQGNQEDDGNESDSSDPDLEPPKDGWHDNILFAKNLDCAVESDSEESSDDSENEESDNEDTESGDDQNISDVNEGEGDNDGNSIVTRGQTGEMSDQHQETGSEGTACPQGRVGNIARESLGNESETGEQVQRSEPRVPRKRKKKRICSCGDSPVNLTSQELAMIAQTDVSQQRIVENMPEECIAEANMSDLHTHVVNTPGENSAEGSVPGEVVNMPSGHCEVQTISNGQDMAQFLSHQQVQNIPDPQDMGSRTDGNVAIESSGRTVRVGDEQGMIELAVTVGETVELMDFDHYWNTNCW